MLARLVVALSAVILAATARGELRDGLILYLPLDEVDGRAAVDASPTRAESAVTGTASWMPSQGAFGGGLSLAGGREERAAQALEIEEKLGAVCVASVGKTAAFHRSPAK